uniref:RING-type domain-containing protein n=1 Tax=Macrostomum lignano TaxID=282301 RepID=A0A1I8FG46_9PLAT
SKCRSPQPQGQKADIACRTSSALSCLRATPKHLTQSPGEQMDKYIRAAAAASPSSGALYQSSSDIQRSALSDGRRIQKCGSSSPAECRTSCQHSPIHRLIECHGSSDIVELPAPSSADPLHAELVLDGEGARVHQVVETSPEVERSHEAVNWWSDASVRCRGAEVTPRQCGVRRRLRLHTNLCLLWHLSLRSRPADSVTQFTVQSALSGVQSPMRQLVVEAGVQLDEAEPHRVEQLCRLAAVDSEAEALFTKSSSDWVGQTVEVVPNKPIQGVSAVRQSAYQSVLLLTFDGRELSPRSQWSPAAPAAGATGTRTAESAVAMRTRTACPARIEPNAAGSPVPAAAAQRGSPPEPRAGPARVAPAGRTAGSLRAAVRKSARTTAGSSATTEARSATLNTNSTQSQASRSSFRSVSKLRLAESPASQNCRWQSSGGSSGAVAAAVAARRRRHAKTDGSARARPGVSASWGWGTGLGRERAGFADTCPASHRHFERPSGFAKALAAAEAERRLSSKQTAEPRDPAATTAWRCRAPSCEPAS